MIKPAAFLLIKTKLNAFKVLKSVKKLSLVKWASVVYGPYQIVAYVEGNTDIEIAQYIEDLRSRKSITELDARMVKVLPNDEQIPALNISQEKVAVLLINVNYREELERNVTYNLRKVEGIKLARAMWGPTDIIAIVEAQNAESMRNRICDDVKVMRGVKSNITLYCYPATE